MIPSQEKFKQPTHRKDGFSSSAVLLPAAPSPCLPLLGLLISPVQKSLYIYVYKYQNYNRQIKTWKRRGTVVILQNTTFLPSLQGLREASPTSPCRPLPAPLAPGGPLRQLWATPAIGPLILAAGQGREQSVARCQEPLPCECSALETSTHLVYLFYMLLLI